jgi:hypothetical protein
MGVNIWAEIYRVIMDILGGIMSFLKKIGKMGGFMVKIPINGGSGEVRDPLNGGSGGVRGGPRGGYPPLRGGLDP